MTPDSFAMSAAACSAGSFRVLYQMATLAPASASAWATPSPMPDVAPETMAVLPLSEKSGMTRFDSGATEALCVNLPSFMSAMFPVVVWKGGP
jgi:hypothetical protein